MNAIKLAGVALIAAGLLGLIYGGFSYTKETTVVNVPLWAGVGAIVVGGLLLVMGGKKG
jgi:hypothetical protein